MPFPQTFYYTILKKLSSYEFINFITLVKMALSLIDGLVKSQIPPPLT